MAVRLQQRSIRHAQCLMAQGPPLPRQRTVMCATAAVAAETCSSLHDWLFAKCCDCTICVPLAVSPHGMQTLRETCNTGKYELIMDKIAGRLGPQYTLDR
jgi:hypothetical protein